MGYSPRGHTESDTTEQLSTPTPALSSHTRDGTQALCTGSVESNSLNQRGSPYNYCYYCHSIDEETEAQDREVIFQGLSSSADCT